MENISKGKSLKGYIREHFDNINTLSGRTIDAIIILLILLSSGIFIVLTHPISDSLRSILKLIDAAIIILFTLEYLLRFWLAEKKTKFFFSIFSIIFVFSGLFYFTEHNANPEIVSTFFDAIYYSVVTMSTVGFGDITPVSSAGRFVTITMIISGIILIPWQISVFLKRIVRTASKVHAICENCGL